MKVIDRMTAVAVAVGPGHQHFRFFEMARGLADWRAGRFDVAAERFRGLGPAANALGPMVESVGRFGQAMTLKAMDQELPARFSYLRAMALLKFDAQTRRDGILNDNWQDRLSAEWLQREARRVLKISESPP
jgi:hypothetical protein